MNGIERRKKKKKKRKKKEEEEEEGGWHNGHLRVPYNKTSTAFLSETWK